MKLLLDTDAALWWRADDERISEGVAGQPPDDTNQVLLSWHTLLAAGAQPLPVTLEHAAA